MTRQWHGADEARGDVSGDVGARGAPPRFPTAAFWLVGGLIGLVKLVTVVTTPDRFRILAFNSDDLHYYVLTALNLAQGNGSTFDGLQGTNGYQPLWFLLLSGAFRVTGVDRPGAYVVTMVLLVVLWGLALLLLHRLSRDVLGATGAPAALLVLLPHARWWTGCENALVVAVLLAAVLLLLRRGLLRPGAPRIRDVALLGVLLAVLVLSRLDTAVLLGVLAVVGLSRWRRIGAVVVLVAPTAVALAVYAAVNQAAFGVPVPVSGLAKQLGPLGRNWSVVGDFLLYGQLGPVPMLLGVTVVAGAALALWLLAPARRSALPEPVRDRAGDLGTVIAVLLAAQLGQLAYYAVASSWELQGWYFSFGVVALVLSAGVVGARLADVRFLRPAVATVLAAFLAVTLLHEATVVGQRDPDADPTTRDIDAGTWADESLPDDAVLAMGDWAGSLAASTTHPVVQLEGLVGSPDYLDALQDGTVPAYLESLGVTHYARLLHPGEVETCRPAEPYFGLGPTATIDVCGAREVYRGSVQGQVDLVIWELRVAS
ncbi:hypothetical protein [Blastococcus sp. URHD0036]|uniref:hypothetical protein n=1 Tax=Blastococcus sp. URHD0036 TaxID=1380356 RepID=UPI0005589F72|nr:hypothetical protein [Blastococcus sp. URHD0036]